MACPLWQTHRMLFVQVYAPRRTRFGTGAAMRAALLVDNVYLALRAHDATRRTHARAFGATRAPNADEPGCFFFARVHEAS